MKSLLRVAARPWTLAFLAFFALSAAWALATPMSGAPDEPSHMIRAAAVVRGELFGTQNAQDPNISDFSLPTTFAKLNRMPGCYEFHPQQPASCQQPLQVDGTTTQVPTTAGTYNPIYYAIVGLPSLVAPNIFGTYLMRLFSAALCSAMMAGALVTALERRRPTWAAIGVAVAATPMVLFFDGMVNPNSIEAASAVLMWSALLALATDPNPELTGRRLRRVAISGLFLANARELGPLWIIAAVICSAFVAESGVVRGLLRDRRAWWTGAGIVASCLIAAVWLEVSKLPVAAPPLEPGGTFKEGARFTFTQTGSYLQQMVGMFGWLDTPAPAGTIFGWYACIGLIGLAALAVSRWRHAVALLALAAGVVVVPILAVGAEFQSFGTGWQGRYLLALAVGLPLMAGAIASRVDWRIGDLAIERRMGWAVCGVLALAGMGAFWTSQMRYAFGTGNALFPLHPRWNPPGTWPVSWLLLLAGAGCLYWLVIGSPRRTGVEAVAETESGDGSDTDDAASEASEGEASADATATTMMIQRISS